jgi:hypothetical protein
MTYYVNCRDIRFLVMLHSSALYRLIIEALSQVKSTGMSPVSKFNEVEDISSEEFKEALNIYIASLPENGRRSVASIEAMLDRGKVCLMVGLAGGKVAFMALLYPIVGTPFVLRDYLATARAIAVGLNSGTSMKITALSA